MGADQMRFLRRLAYWLRPRSYQADLTESSRCTVTCWSVSSARAERGATGRLSTAVQPETSAARHR